MTEISCPVCGLPKELCLCSAVAKEQQKIVVKTVKRRFGKIMTLIEGLDPKTINIKDTAKQLKAKCACGGTSKDNVIELQGDHKSKLKQALMGLGFSEESIEVQ